MPEWEAADQRVLRNSIPENRLRVYDVRELISNMADTDSVLELRPFFGLAMVTSLVRIEGRSVGVVANNCMHLSGAIDADAADKATRFIKCAFMNEFHRSFLDCSNRKGKKTQLPLGSCAFSSRSCWCLPRSAQERRNGN